MPLTALRLVGQGAEFLGWVVLARQLGAGPFGRLSVAFLICRYGGLVADWGATFRGARDVAAGAATADLSRLVRLRANVAVALTALYVVIVIVTGNAALAPVAAVVIAGGWSRDWMALGREEAVRSSIPTVLRGVVLVVGAVAITELDSAALVIAIAYGGGTLVSVLLNRRPPSAGGRAASTDAWILIAVVMAQIYTTLDTILLATLRSTREAGIYAAVYRVPLAWVTVVGLLVTAYVPVATATLRDDRTQIARLRRQALRAGLMGGVGVLASIPLTVPFVTALFGGAFASGRGPMALVLVATAVATTSAPLGALYLSIGRDRNFALLLSAGAIVNVATNLLVIPAFGMSGAAITTIASEGLVLAGLTVLVFRQ